MQTSEMKVPTTEQIEQRAYGLYCARGGEEGHALEDWLAAEKELTQSPVRFASGEPRTRAAAAGFQPASQETGRIAGETPTKIASK
jgi:hypothetical protein